ncbi:S-layer homology domain-containing protein [Saccharibacillus qingshengii]|uniref:S-layer homology domain-containing protein n=1 Tax=Saccharibacillus qingshengii TaxID=1763540 RepID=UPI001555B415|nr:S-layer homology domain-containing protein [Saccharibacillus qingshengii]
MKKIVSLALSTAMALSMFASVSSAATMTTQEKYDALVTQGIFAGYPNGQAYLDKDMTRAEFAKVVALLTNLDTTATGTNTYQDKNYANAWYKSYVEAVTKAGYMKGTTTGAKKLFNPNGKVTVQEMAATLVRAAKLEIPTTGINNTASAWAKGEVQAAINAGLVSGTANFSAAATRGLLVDTAYAYQTAVVKPAVTSYEVTDNGATVVFTLVNGEKVTVKPATALKANVATTVTFTYAGKEYSESVTWKVTTATKAESAAATNLKEVDVTFNGEVNASTAEDKSKYVITSLATDAVDSAELLEGGNVVRLTLKDALTFTNQEDYTVRVTGVTAGTATLPTANLTFRPLDNVLPTVTAVTGLGTKAVKVTFSEPIRTANANNFRLNDTAFVGSVELSENHREAVLRPYTAFPVGTHTLTSSLVEDYAGLKSLSANNEFTVATDTTPPTVSEISATLERAVVTFSEEIDPNTVATSDFYWLNGTTKNYPSEVNRLAGNKYELLFTGTSVLPAYTTNLFVDTVSDYTGNANTVKQFAVTAVVDQTRPVVTDITYNTTGANAGQITVRFDRNVNFTTTNFTLTDSDGKVVAVLSAAGTGTRTAVLSIPNNQLESGTYSLAIAGVKDRTVLENAIEPVTRPFTVGDTANPSVVGAAVVNVANRTVTLSFDEAMDPAKLQDTNNYVIDYNGQMRLPTNAQIRVANNYKSVVITLPSTINNVATDMGALDSVTPLGVTDLANNPLNNPGTAILTSAAQADILTAELTDVNKIVVTFDQSIESARATDFVVTGATVQNATVSGDKVTLTTSANVGTSSVGLDVKVAANNRITTVAGNGVDTTVTPTTALVADKVAPEVNVANNATLTFQNNVILLPFSENLDPANEGAWAGDLIVTNRITGNVVPSTGYTTTWDAASKSIRIALTGAPAAQYSVKVRAGNTTITDASAAKNKAAESSLYTTGTQGNVAAPTVTIAPLAARTNQTSVTVTGTAPTGSQVVVSATTGTPATTADTKTVTAANGTYSVTLTGLNATAPGTAYTITATATNVGGTDTETTTVTVDQFAPTVTTTLPVAGFEYEANVTDDLVFSEDLNASSKANVKSVVDAALDPNGTAAVSTTWVDDSTLRITVTGITVVDPANNVTVGTIAPIAVTDTLGNTTAAPVALQ